MSGRREANKATRESFYRKKRVRGTRDRLPRATRRVFCDRALGRDRSSGARVCLRSSRSSCLARTFVNVSPWLSRYSSLVMTCWHLRASSWDSLKQRASCSTAPFSIPQKGENSIPSSESSSRFFMPSGATPCADSAMTIAPRVERAEPASQSKRAGRARGCDLEIQSHPRLKAPRRVFLCESNAAEP